MNNGQNILHAMLLDSVVNGKLVFKNTYVEQKQVEININDDQAPHEFFFLDITVKEDEVEQDEVDTISTVSSELYNTDSETEERTKIPKPELPKRNSLSQQKTRKTHFKLLKKLYEKIVN